MFFLSNNHYRKCLSSRTILYEIKFEKTLEIIHAAKNECLIIGDSLTSDIKGGIESGIDTCYLHLGKSPGTSDTRIKYHASSYSELLSIIYADQVDIENK